MNELKGKQLKFVEEYCHPKCRNATEAAIKAGYSEKTARAIGCENLTKPNIQKAIAERIAGQSERLQIDADWVLAQAVKVYQRCMQEEAVKDSEGNPTGEYKFEHSGANKALDLIAKHIDVRAYADKNINLNADINHLVEKVERHIIPINKDKGKDIEALH